MPTNSSVTAAASEGVVDTPPRHNAKPASRNSSHAAARSQATAAGARSRDDGRTSQGQRAVCRHGGADREWAVRRPAIDGKDERQLPDEMRCYATLEDAALVQPLPDEPHVPEPQVAEATVDQLRGRARRLGAEVGAFEQCDAEPVLRRERGRARPDDPAADDDDVELCERLHCA